MVWETDCYVKEAQKQLGYENIYKKVNCKEKLLSGLVDKSNSFFKELKIKGCMFFGKKTLKCFTYELTSIKTLLI